MGTVEEGVEVEAVSAQKLERLEVGGEYSPVLRPQIELMTAQLP